MVLPLLAKLQNSEADWTILAEVACALGKIPDKRSIQPLYDLDRKLQAIRDLDNADRCADSIPGRNRASGRSPGQKGSSLI
jgi:HEAT repeat protein